MTIIAEKPFLEKSDGVFRSISSMLDSCQKRQIEYLAIFRNGIQYGKYRSVSAGVCISLTCGHCKQFWLPCLKKV